MNTPSTNHLWREFRKRIFKPQLQDLCGTLSFNPYLIFYLSLMISLHHLTIFFKRKAYLCCTFYNECWFEHSLVDSSNNKFAISLTNIKWQFVRRGNYWSTKKIVDQIIVELSNEVGEDQRLDQSSDIPYDPQFE